MKKTQFPAEQQRPDVLKARESFREAFSEVDAQELIFLDESGLHLGMTRLYGRGLSHERVKCLVPFNKGTRVTMVAAIGVGEVKASWYGDWHLDGNIFMQFIKECLVPVIQPGQVVVMDNLQAHKVSGVKELIERTGARLVYLPAYSPDFTPIELFWSKIKSHIRKREASNLKELGKAITEAFNSIETDDLENWFEHCGYSIH